MTFSSLAKISQPWFSPIQSKFFKTLYKGDLFRRLYVGQWKSLCNNLCFGIRKLSKAFQKYVQESCKNTLGSSPGKQILSKMGRGALTKSTRERDSINFFTDKFVDFHQFLGSLGTFWKGLRRVGWRFRISKSHFWKFDSNWTHVPWESSRFLSVPSTPCRRMRNHFVLVRVDCWVRVDRCVSFHHFVRVRLRLWLQAFGFISFQLNLVNPSWVWFCSVNIRSSGRDVCACRAARRALAASSSARRLLPPSQAPPPSKLEWLSARAPESLSTWTLDRSSARALKGLSALVCPRALRWLSTWA